MKDLMRKLLLLSVSALVFPMLALADGKQEKYITHDSMEAFKALESRQPDNEWIAKQSGAELAWGESYRLMAYVAMYEASGDVEYLEKVMGRFDEIIKIRDDKKMVKDEIRGRILPAWCSTKYTGGKEYAWIVHAGMITYPITRFAYLILRDSELKEHYGEKARGYVAAIEETVHAFDDAWREDRSKNEGWYYGDYLEKGLPLNQQNALGRTLAALWLATGKEQYRERAEKLANFFNNCLKRIDNRYVWSYWPYGGSAEDISHAAINVDFAFTCYRANILFAKRDMIRFANTLKACIREEGFAGKVDGSGDLRYSIQMGRWGHLGFIDREIRNILHGYLSMNWKKNTATGMTGAAYLVETQARLRIDDVLRKR
jgi:hypothetical protein